MIVDDYSIWSKASSDLYNSLQNSSPYQRIYCDIIMIKFVTDISDDCPLLYIIMDQTYKLKSLEEVKILKEIDWHLLPFFT
jgi:hypothetical protein